MNFSIKPTTQKKNVRKRKLDEEEQQTQEANSTLIESIGEGGTVIGKDGTEQILGEPLKKKLLVINLNQSNNDVKKPSVVQKTVAQSSFGKDKFGLQIMPKTNLQPVNRLELTRQRDIQILPKELDPNDRIYEQIPVSEFGEALLRGMGWSGEPTQTFVDDLAAVARVGKLGLGAELPQMPEQTTTSAQQKDELLGQDDEL